ncbi:hypothetical protein H6P81_003198 [Aristolochia fimbriata]|uniref:Retrotransposon gag domain-containing protein n=1 Tax=Aristolochia fimbriata TaxID=158543 RepID=A0AAV7FBW2_ARIFI|nr:hypothetical protein H6P81_003198 [Aristolochia fimbriata]
MSNLDARQLVSELTSMASSEAETDLKTRLLKGKEKLTRAEQRLLSLEERLEKLKLLRQESACIVSNVSNFSLNFINELREDVHSTFVVLRANMDEQVEGLRNLREDLEEDKGDTEALKGDMEEIQRVDNFLWQVEKYVKTSRVTDEEHTVSTLSLFLVDDVTLCWRRSEVDMKSDTAFVETWEQFKREFKAQFYPEDVDYQARKELRALKQTGMIKEYVSKFNSFMLQIPDMYDQDKLFSFLVGVHPWVENELQRREVKSLASAMSTPERLTEFERKTEGNSKSSNDKKNPKKQEKKKFEKKFDKRDSRQSSKFDERKKKGDKGKSFRLLSCFICDEEHMAKDYPKNKKLNALVNESDKAEKHGEETHMGSMMMLNVVHSQVKQTTTSSVRSRRELLFADMHVQGGSVMRSQLITSKRTNQCNIDLD